MSGTDQERTLEGFRLAIAALAAEPYELTLFVSGASESSAQAIANVREICDAYLHGRHVLSIVDLNQEPGLAAGHRVLATPTLVKEHPAPLRMLVGDMSDHERILSALQVARDGEAGASTVEATAERTSA